jgi:hypothetical protein
MIRKGEYGRFNNGRRAVKSARSLKPRRRCRRYLRRFVSRLPVQPHELNNDVHELLTGYSGFPSDLLLPKGLSMAGTIEPGASFGKNINKQEIYTATTFDT